MSRFQEHDYSLSAARRAMHLLTLDHFMHRPLSALATVVIDAGDAADAANEETAAVNNVDRASEEEMLEILLRARSKARRIHTGSHTTAHAW